MFVNEWGNGFSVGQLLINIFLSQSFQEYFWPVLLGDGGVGGPHTHVHDTHAYPGVFHSNIL